MARCLDVSRLISRVGRGPMTGIDRVEFAYLTHLLARPEPLWLLCRTALGHVLLDRRGAERLRGLLAAGEAAPWDRLDLPGRLLPRRSLARRRAEATLRRLAVGRAPRGWLAGMLRRHLPAGTAYVNVGHTDLDARVLAAWRAVPAARIAVMVHDTIPLDHPEFQRPGVPARFAAMLARIGGAADMVICNSAFTESRLRHWLSRLAPGAAPRTIVAHLGVEPSPPDAAALPEGLPPAGPYFVTVGTIEPRKNHALLLNLWEALERQMPAGQVPALCIVGARGWAEAGLLARLDALARRGGPVREIAGLADPAVSALVAGAAGALFPSRAEGYGLPPMEAAALGTRVLCAELVAVREVLGDRAVYASADDMYFWLQTTRRWAEDRQADRPGPGRILPVPRWSEHFELVLKAT